MFAVSKGQFHSHTAASELLTTGLEASITSRQTTLLTAPLATSRRVSSWCWHGNQYPKSIGSQDALSTATNGSLDRPSSVGAQKSTSSAKEGLLGDAAGDRRPPAFLDLFLEDITASNDGAAAADGVTPVLLTAATSQRPVERPKESFVSSIFTREAGGRRHTATNLRNLPDSPRPPSPQTEPHTSTLRADKGHTWQPAAASAGSRGHPLVDDQPWYALPQSQAFSEPASTSSNNSSNPDVAGEKASLFRGADLGPTRSGRAGTPIDKAGQSYAESTSGRTGKAGGAGQSEDVAPKSRQALRKRAHAKWRLELEKERAAENREKGGGSGDGGGGGKPRGKGESETEKLYRTMTSTSSSIPRDGIYVEFQLPDAPLAGAVVSPAPTLAPTLTPPSVSPSSSKSASNTDLPAVSDQDSTDSVTPAPTGAAAKDGAPHWATMPLSFHFAPIFKLCEANAPVEESQIPSDLVEIARRMHDSASQDTSSARTASSNWTEGEDEKEEDEMILEWVSGYLSDEDGGPGRSAPRRSKGSSRATQPQRAKWASIVPGCTAYTMPGGVEVLLVQNSRSIEAAVNWLRLSVMDDGVLGIDTEWPPCRIAGVTTVDLAMIQIASPNRVLLVHIAVMRGKDPASTARDGALYALLSDPSLTWVAAGWGKGDHLAMQRAFDGEVPPMKLVDVQAAAAAAGWPRLGLQALVRDLLGAREFSKSRRLTITNWAARDLGPRQVRYAALDALLPPLLLRQLRLFAAMPGLRCSFCKQAFHAPAGVQQRAPQQQQPPVPAATAGPRTAPSPSSAPAAPSDTPTCEAEQGQAAQPKDSTDTAAMTPLLSCDHCGRAFWAAQKP